MQKKWTKEEIYFLEQAYRNKIPQKEIAEHLGRSFGSIKAQIIKLQLPLKYSIYKNNSTYKACYQDYEWCYQKYIVEGLNIYEMANIANVKPRTIQKWCGEIHHLNLFTYKEHKKLNELQMQIIISGILGDGHIVKEKGIYIESHSIEEKDYVFWKYNQLKDCCNNPPSYYEGAVKKFPNNKLYKCKPSYRFNTREINQLKDIKKLSKIEIIDKLTIQGLCLFILDDGSYDTIWTLCVADFSQDEIDYFINTIQKKFKLDLWQQNGDKRYISFSSNSSRTIISWMLELFPNDMDILHKKFLDKHIPQKPNYIRVIKKNGIRIGLAQWCKDNNWFSSYERIRDIIRDKNISEIQEEQLLTICKRGKIKWNI